MEGFHLLSGDVAGNGTLGDYGGNISNTDVCWRLCLNTPGCKSYEFSIRDKRCKLNSVDEPNAAQYGDYTFCAKTSNTPFIKFLTCFYFNINSVQCPDCSSFV